MGRQRRLGLPDGVNKSTTHTYEKFIDDLNYTLYFTFYDAAFVSLLFFNSEFLLKNKVHILMTAFSNLLHS
jgi:hypothetical protein